MLSPRKKKLKLEWKVLLLQHLIKNLCENLVLNMKLENVLEVFPNSNIDAMKRRNQCWQLNGKIILGSYNI